MYRNTKKKQAVKGKGHRKCSKCGDIANHRKSRCPTKNVMCFSCEKKGHFKNICVTKAIREGNKVEVDSVLLGSVTAGGDAWMVELGVGGGKVQFQIDMRDDVTIIPEHMFNQAYEGNT